MRIQPALPLSVLLIFVAGCFESNPQPSPGGGAEGYGPDARRQPGGADVKAPGADALIIDAANHGEDSVADVLPTADLPDVPDSGEVTPDALVPELPGGDLPGPDALPPECSYCLPPYPACTLINGTWACVQCTEDAHCAPNGTCDTAIFTCCPCVDDPPMPSSCSGDDDCPEGHPCNPEASVCYDPVGWCDGVQDLCNWTAGSECVNALTALFGDDLPFPGGIPGMPEDKGLCTCTDPLPISEDLLSCLADGSCDPSPLCHPGQVCTQLEMLCNMLFGPCPAPDPEAGICVGPGFFDALLL
ncbi:MAG: hypothetical protein FJ098_08775 [Deltaproteobacteria bacterium]|nr:hypothetical protein [Deltaproteobacteria bacterium]